jgi:hypothetical protein
LVATLAVSVEVAVVAGGGGVEKSMTDVESDAVGRGKFFPVTVEPKVTVGVVVRLKWFTEVRVKTSVVDAVSPLRNWPRLAFADVILAYGRVATLLLSNPPFWIVSGGGVKVPSANSTQTVVPETLESAVGQPVWYPIDTPPVGVVPVMLKTAVNRRPVLPVGMRTVVTTARRTVSKVSVVLEHVDPCIRTPPTHFTRIDETGRKVPVRSVSYGLSFVTSPTFRVMSITLKVAVLLIMIGTLSNVLGVVTGPLKTGGEVGHLVSVGWATQTIPVSVAGAQALGII